MKHRTDEIHGFRARGLRRGFCLGLLGLGLAALVHVVAPVNAQDAANETIAVLPFEINDTSGEVGQTARHEKMLTTITHLVGEKLGENGLFKVVPQADVDKAVTAVDSGTYLRSCNGCELDIAKRVSADNVLIGWFYKVSTLVGTMHIVIKDVATGKTVYAHVFDFRGDNEEAWQRAVAYMVRSMAKPKTQERLNTN